MTLSDYRTSLDRVRFGSDITERLTEGLLQELKASDKARLRRLAIGGGIVALAAISWLVQRSVGRRGR